MAAHRRDFMIEVKWLKVILLHLTPAGHVI